MGKCKGPQFWCWEEYIDPPFGAADTASKCFAYAVVVFQCTILALRKKERGIVRLGMVFANIKQRLFLLIKISYYDIIRQSRKIRRYVFFFCGCGGGGDLDQFIIQFND